MTSVSMFLALGAAAPLGTAATTVAVTEGVAEPDSETGVTGSVEASFANATGNTENLTLIVSGKLTADGSVSKHNFAVGARYAEAATPSQDERQQTQEAFFASYQFDAELSDQAFAFARARYDYDGFSGFKHRVFTGGGLGYRFYENEQINWNVSGGPGIRWTTFAEPDPLPADFEVEKTEFSVYASSELAWDISEAVGFEHDARATYTSASTTLESEAALKSKLTERLAARVSFRVQHETDPLAMRAATDTLLTAGLNYGF